MKKLLGVTLVGLFLFTALPGWSQTLPRVEEIQDFWEMGERRVYIFHSDSARLGKMNSLMYGAIVDYDGNILAYKLQSKLTLDLTSHGNGPRIQTESMLSFDLSGFFVSADLNLTVNDRQDQMKMRFDSTSQTMYIQKGEDYSDAFTETFEPRMFTYDPYLVDQLSIILAMNDLNMGESLEVPVFSPQGLYRTTYELKLVDKVAIRHSPIADSVWQIEILRPSRQTAYIDDKRRLIQLRDRDNGIAAELGWIDASIQKTDSDSPKEVISNFRDRIPQYGIYLVAALIWLLFLGRNGFQEKWSYILFVVGAAVYLLINVTHDPLQLYYGRAVLENSETSIAWLGIPPALITGFIHEALKLIPLFIVARLAKPGTVLLIAMGAFVGAGFGFFEACQSSLSNDPILKLIIAANIIFMLLFQTTTGALLGYGLGRRKIWTFFPIAIGLNAFIHYLAFVVGSGRPSLDAIKNLTIYQALISIVFLAIVLMLRFRYIKAHETRGKKRKR